MTRVPAVDADNNSWGDVLNSYLDVGHDSSGNSKYGSLATYRVGSYGGGTGVGATDTAAVTAAIAAANAAGGGTILFERASTNKITSTITLASNLRLYVEEAATLDCSAMTGTSVNVFQTLANNYTESSNSTNLSANATRGDTTVTIAAGAEASFTVGDYVKVKSTANWVPEVFGTNTTMDGWLGEIGRIKSISSGLLTLWWPLMDSYATADTATVGTITTFSNVIFEGTGTIVGRSGASRDRFLTLDKCISPRVRGLQMYAFADVYVNFRDCLFGVVNEVYCEADGTSTSSSDYGVDFCFATQWSTVTNSTFRGVRHSATTDTIPNVRAGIPRFISYVNNRAFNTRASSFDTHSIGEYVSIIGNHSYKAADSGVNGRCPNMIVANNQIVNPGQYGVYLRNQSDRASRYIVEGNYIREAGLNGIILRNPAEASLSGSTAGQTQYGTIIQGNIVEKPTKEGIVLSSDAAWQIKNAIVQGNQVMFPSATVYSGIRFINATACNVVGNIVDGANIGLRLDNACTGFNVFANQLPNCTTKLSLGTGANHISTTADSSGAYNQGVTTVTVGPFSFDFELGTDTATVATTDPGDNDNWDAVTIGASAALIYDTTRAYKGSQSGKVSTGASAVQSLLEWDFPSVTDHYGRLVAYFTANPGGSMNIVRANNGSNLACEINLDTTGKFRLVNAAGTVVGTSTNVIPLNQWFMLQWRFVHNAATGTMDVKLYSTPTDAAALETLSATALNTEAGCTVLRIGNTTSVANIGPFWIDSITGVASAYPGSP